MTARPTATAVRRALRSVATPERARATAWFFKTGPGEYGEGDRFLGVTVPDQRRVAREFADLAPAQSVKLLRSAWHEERLTALFILVRQYERGRAAERDAIFRLYLANLGRINNWDLVDSSAPQIVGRHLRQRDRGLLRKLARSDVLWERRVAILATAAFIREGDFRDTFALARLLQGDRQDLMHKAVGWMLREVANRDRAEVERFLDRHAATMPRTMLRYAIEKFPDALRRHYLARKRTLGPSR